MTIYRLPLLPFLCCLCLPSTDFLVAVHVFLYFIWHHLYTDTRECSMWASWGQQFFIYVFAVMSLAPTICPSWDLRAPQVTAEHVVSVSTRTTQEPWPLVPGLKVLNNQLQIKIDPYQSLLNNEGFSSFILWQEKNKLLVYLSYKKCWWVLYCLVVLPLFPSFHLLEE